MPTFDTPQPISVALDIVVGDVHVIASDRADTTVEVRPSNDAHEPDRRLAAQTRVEYADGHLSIVAPKMRALGLFVKHGSIDVTIELPTGSRLHGDASVATFRCAGRLGECRVRTSTGDIQFGQTGPLDLHTGAGAVMVDHVAGHAEVDTGSGRIRLREIDGTAVVKNSNGDTWIGAAAGDLRASAANGDIRVDRANADVTASTANGAVRVGGLARGTAELSTSFGQIEVGIATGTAARLDVQTKFGRVDNQLAAAAKPEPSDETVSVRARTSYGDIVIRRTHTYPEEGE